MKLSIIIPIYNEDKTLEKIIKKISDVKLKIKKEIILIDDGSHDKSREILKKYSKKKGFKVILKKQNEGKGAAVITGLKASKGDILLIQDADLEYEPKDYPKLLIPLLENKAKVVYGSRFKSNKGHLKDDKLTYSLHTIGNRFLTGFTNFLYNSNLTDMETCYKVFTREVYNKLNLKSKRFEFEPEITSKILKNNFKIIEVPINYYSRGFKEGKKITIIDGLKAVYYLLKFKLFD
ncbi:MAG: glycosyltransferase family 2 protein [Candidatus Nanoarchaeia archaeon]|nr:glycosyltransferase family 2 protein [Candidatus Nanoarchaeia archaeon]